VNDQTHKKHLTVDYVTLKSFQLHRNKTIRHANESSLLAEENRPIIIKIPKSFKEAEHSEWKVNNSTEVGNFLGKQIFKEVKKDKLPQLEIRSK
jgi:hypothetical protein